MVGVCSEKVFLVSRRSSPLPRAISYDIDERNIPPLNRIGDPDDILASVRVENGKVGLLSQAQPFFLSGPTDRDAHL